MARNLNTKNVRRSVYILMGVV